MYYYTAAQYVYDQYGYEHGGDEIHYCSELFPTREEAVADLMSDTDFDWHFNKEDLEDQDDVRDGGLAYTIHTVEEPARPVFRVHFHDIDVTAVDADEAIAKAEPTATARRIGWE